MITPKYVHTMACYNQWQNESIYSAGDELDEAELQKDRGAFFGSIQRTLSHLLWGDTLWLHRFAGTEEPSVGSIGESADMEVDWGVMKSQRVKTDNLILDWASRIQPSDIAGELSWFSGAMNREITKPRAMLFVHFFNHQTHHRGQVHAMLTAAGGKPDDTDLPFMD